MAESAAGSRHNKKTWTYLMHGAPERMALPQTIFGRTRLGLVCKTDLLMIIRDTRVI
jgi:hypothetical protein